MEAPREEKLLKLLDLLEENYEAIETAIKLVAALKRSGMLDAMLEIAERSDEIFNAAVRAELMKSLGNMMMLVYMLGQLDNFKLMMLAESLPKCVEEAEKAAGKGGGMGIRELLRVMTSPEMAAALRAFQASMKCFMGGGEGRSK